MSEIGVRVALGAGPLRLLVQIVGQGMRPVAVGIGVGLVGALALSGLLRTLLFGITPGDPVTYASVAVILAAAALGSCALPALSALRVDPVSALQKE